MCKNKQKSLLFVYIRIILLWLIELVMKYLWYTIFCYEICAVFIFIVNKFKWIKPSSLGFYSDFLAYATQSTVQHIITPADLIQCRTILSASCHFRCKNTFTLTISFTVCSQVPFLHMGKVTVYRQIFQRGGVNSLETEKYFP
jgi:hypothetical protein